jgi:hypothetical protein
MNAPAFIKEAESLHDLAWWAAEREQTGTDWRGILLTVMRGLGVIAPCHICEREPCQTPSFCQLCREADAKASQQRRTVRPQPTPWATVEAIKQAVRDGGIAALKDAGTRERLRQCDVAARTEIDKWLTRFKEAPR